MTLDVAGVLADAWRMWKRDRDVLLGVAGLFLFLPQLAMELLVPPLPTPPNSRTDTAALELWWDAVQAWSSQHGLILILVGVALVFGALAVFTLYLDRSRPDTRGALIRALGLLPRYLLASLVISLPVEIGLLLFVLPGTYALGRLMLTGPAIVAERPCGALRAIWRSLALTKGHGLVLAGFACVALFGGNLLAMPFRTLGKTLDGAPLANPVVAALLGSGAAAGMTIGMLAALLIEVALYRRLSASAGI